MEGTEQDILKHRLSENFYIEIIYIIPAKNFNRLWGDPPNMEGTKQDNLKRQLAENFSKNQLAPHCTIEHHGRLTFENLYQVLKQQLMPLFYHVLLPGTISPKMLPQQSHIDTQKSPIFSQNSLIFLQKSPKFSEGTVHAPF